MFVQFTDSTETKIAAVFGCAQDPTAYPNQGDIPDTDARYLAFINPNQLPSQAQAALDKSDTTIIRCYSAGVATPTSWETYRAELRAIVNGSDTTSTSLPATPTYPANT
jgi:hypothetical protein